MKRIIIDIDNTICYTKEGDYKNSFPVIERIKQINKLYDEGVYIIFWTARGAISGIDWEELTREQLQNWDVKHHELWMKKPHYDLFICDKAINSNTFFGE